MNEEPIKPLIELDKYLITFIADYTGFLYIEADSARVHIENISNITFKDILSKFYIEANSYVVIQYPVNLRKIKFEKFTKQEQEEVIKDNAKHLELFENLKNKFEDKK